MFLKLFSALFIVQLILTDRTSTSKTSLCVSVLSCVQLPVAPWTIACQAPRSIGFPRQEYWSGLPVPSPGDLPYQELSPGLLHCRQILYQLSYEGSPTHLLSRRERERQRERDRERSVINSRMRISGFVFYHRENNIIVLSVPYQIQTILYSTHFA